MASRNAGWPARLAAAGGGLLALGLLLAGGDARAAQPQPMPSPESLAQGAARRFPQPVRVGDLVGRKVLRRASTQEVLGRVREVVRREDGAVQVVMDYGGVLGFLARPIAVPVEAMTLVGYYMEVFDLTPEQLDGLATFDGTGAAPLPPDGVIRVGLNGPTH